MTGIDITFVIEEVPILKEEENPARDNREEKAVINDAIRSMTG